MVGVAHCVLYLNYFYKVVYTEHLFSFWEAGVFVRARQRVPMWLAPMKTLGTDSLMHFSGRQILSQLIAEEIKCTLCNYTGRLLETYAWFPTDFIPGAISLVDFTLNPFAVV